MGRYSASLTEISLDDLRHAGGKGANLGHLTRAGFTVPSGFCVLSSAYYMFLDTSDLKHHIREKIDTISFSYLPGVEESATAIRDLMRSAPIPGAIAGEIEEAYEKLVSDAGENVLLAVRSSVGTRDLKTTSFPGQMDTYHNLRGKAEVLEKVRECWASAFSYAAMVNRHTRGIEHFEVFVAPVVQMMVDAERAGVIFTVDPLGNSRDLMVIDACLGLGESVVSGRMKCDHFVVDRNSMRVLEEDIAAKRSMIVLDSERGRGNLEIPLAEEEGSRPSISGDQVRELAVTALEVEDSYGSPQDIEWAFQDDRLYILQSRRITSAAYAADEEEGAAEEWVCEFDSTIDPEYDEYTLSNISEVLPGVLTPLSISDIDSLDYGFVKSNADLGLMKHIKPKSELTFLGVFYGRAHLNLSVARAMISQLPGANLKEFDRREEGGDGGGKLWRPTPRNLAILPGILTRLFIRAVKTPGEAAALGEDYEVKIAEAKRVDLARAPYALIFGRMDESRGELFHAMALHIMISELAVTYFDFLCKITARWLDDERGMLAARLVTGLQSLESARPSTHIWDLSRLVKKSQRLRDIFESNREGDILQVLEADGSPEAGGFLESLEVFLYRFGYRGIFEAEAMMPNWDEDPSYLFAAIKNYLEADPDSSPRIIAEKQEKDRERAMLEAMSRLRGPQRLLLRYLVKQAQTYISLREYMKSILIKGLTHGKKVYRALSRRLARQGILREPDDIYFLTSREIEALAMGRGESIPVDELVARRRAEYENNLDVILPEHSKGRPRPLTPRELETREEVETLRGIGVSPGKVTGRARVITDPLRDAEIKPGEILVAPVTDAAWSPLFVTAAAAVVEVGGPLSHGSIVAREFGLPCVVNASSATRIVKTGQKITVDGGRGKVHLHPAEK
ncbi:MAG: PEP/pyruvate-binding domain-containing protein [Actinomycetota bacterium]|nr:PEP/pyruvate-binding domain-containing protein [Actinomycetota bacterium]